MRGWTFAALAALGLLVVLLAGDPWPPAMLRWYLSLQRPAWQPPDWLIPLVWLVIYGLIGFAVIRAWRSADAAAGRDAVVRVTTANLFLNFLWALLFFVHRRPDWALIEVALLWLSILWMMAVLGRLDRLAAWLLAPYLAWVGFAAILNLALVQLNAPFP